MDLNLYKVKSDASVSPIPTNLSAFEKAYEIRDKRHTAALEAQSNLKASLATLDLNEAENGYREQLYNQINNVIEQNSQNGYSHTAYDDIIRLTGDIISNPGLNARLKAQKEYQAYQDQIDKSTLPELYKEYYKAKNKYKYNDVYDSNGKVIGGSNWTPTSSPVEQIDYFKVFNEAIKNIKTDEYSSKVLRYRDKNGNLKTTYSDGDEPVWYDAVTNTTTSIDKELVRKAVNAYVDTHPEVMASLQQDRDVAFWATNNGKEAYFHSKDNAGVKLGLEDFKNEVFNKYIEGYDYSSNIRSVEINKDYATDIAALKKAEIAERNAKIKEGQASLNEVMGYKFRSATASKAVIVDTNNITDASIRSQVDNNLKSVYKQIYKKDFNGDILNFDNFKTIIDSETNPLVRQQLQESYNESVLLYGEAIMNNNRILSNTSNADYRDCVEFQQARLDGSGFKENGGKKYNELVSQWNDIINTFFPEDTQEVRFNLNSDNFAKRFKELVGSNYSTYGIKFDGNSVIVDKDHAKYLPEIAAILNQSFDVARMFQTDRGDITLIDENGNKKPLRSKSNLTFEQEIIHPVVNLFNGFEKDTDDMKPELNIFGAIQSVLKLSKSLTDATAPVDNVLLEERLYTGGTPQAAIAQAYLNGHNIGNKFEGQTQEQINKYIEQENKRVLEMIVAAQSGTLTIKAIDDAGLPSELNFKESKKVVDDIRTQMNSQNPDIQLHYKPDRETLGGATRITIAGKSYDILGIHDPNEDDLVDVNWLKTQNDIDIAIGTDRIVTLGYLGNRPITFNTDEFKSGNISIRDNISDDDPYVATKFGVINMRDSDTAYYEQVINVKHLEGMIMSFRDIIAQNRNQDGTINLNKDFIDMQIAPVILSYLQGLQLLTNVNDSDKEKLIEGVEYQLGVSLKELGLS